MKITENRTVDQAVKYFEDSRTMFADRRDPMMDEVYAEAFSWKRKHVPFKEWKDWPIEEVCKSIIYDQYM